MYNRFLNLLIVICLTITSISLYYIYANTAFKDKFYQKVKIYGIEYEIRDGKDLENRLKSIIESNLPNDLKATIDGESYIINIQALNIKPDKNYLINYGKGNDLGKVLNEGINILLSEGVEIEYSINISPILDNLEFKFDINSDKYITTDYGEIINCNSKTINSEIDTELLTNTIKEYLKDNKTIVINSIDLVQDHNTKELINTCRNYLKDIGVLNKITESNIDWDNIIGIQNNGYYIKNEENLIKELEKISESKNIEANDGIYFIKNNKAYFYKYYTFGRELNINDSIDNIRNWLNNTNNKSDSLLSFNQIIPNIFNSNYELIDVSMKMGEGISRLDLYRDGVFNYRVPNSQAPLWALNNYVIEPQEVFSFHNDSGVATGSVRSGIGVCNSTTTLFRAALHSGLKIVSRSPHTSYIPSYEYGANYPLNIVEATYFHSPIVDLKFKNDTNYPIVLKVTIDRRNDGYQYHTVEIYTNPNEPKREVELTDFKQWDYIDGLHFKASFKRIIRVNNVVKSEEEYKVHYYE